MTEFAPIIASMIGTIAVIDLIAIILQGTKKIEEVGTEKGRINRAISLGIVGGLFGIYATMNGYEMPSGAIVAIRDVGPMMAGCLGGPFGGFIAGIMAGLYRLFQGISDITAGTTIPCTISTILIGLMCGVLFKPFHLNKRRGRFAFVIAIFMEIIHLFLTFIYLWIMQDITTSWSIISEITPAFLFSNAIAFGLLIFTTDMIDRYKLAESNKEKIEAELDTATNIQMSMLPVINENFPGRKEFEIYASMTPARQVGGDFYDSYFIDDDHFVFLVADVSGKGVPAALFMALAKTIIKNNLQLGLSLEAAIEKSNNQLTEENKESLFLTAWIGLLEISTGKLEYINAGHNPPVLKKDNQTTYLKDRSGFILAANKDLKYKVYSMNLEKCDTIFMYTDGVTEATDISNKLYGEDRLLDVFSKNYNSSMENVCKKVKEDIDKFAHDAEQFDDITMVSFCYKGGDD